MRQWLKVALPVILVIVYPLVLPSSYAMHLGVMTALWVLLATSMNLMIGHIGLISLGQTAFFGLGAFGAGLLSVKLGLPWPLTLPAGILVAMLGAGLIGLVTLRLRGAYYVLGSLGLAEVLRATALNWVDFTGGPMGLGGISPIRINLGPWHYALNERGHYYLVWAIALLLLLVVYRLLHSYVGRGWLGLAVNERLASSVGINWQVSAMGTLLVSALLAGVAGAFYAHYITFVSPEVFGITYTIQMIIMVLVGGRRTFVGPILGALVFTLLPELLRVTDQFRMIILGTLTIIVVLFMPRGLVPWLKSLRKTEGGKGAMP